MYPQNLPNDGNGQGNMHDLPKNPLGQAEIKNLKNILKLGSS